MPFSPLKRTLKGAFRRNKPALSPSTGRQDSPTGEKSPATPILPLPYELQSQILCLLDGHAVLQLRQVSKDCLGLVRLHESAIARTLWQAHFEDQPTPCICEPRPDFLSLESMPASPTLSDYCQLVRRERTAERVAETLVDFLEEKILRMHIRPGANEQLWNMRVNLVGRLGFGLGHLQYFWSKYRENMAASFQEAPQSEVRETDRQGSVINAFSIPCLLETFCAYEILLLAMMMKFKPKTYAGYFERLIRRWNHDPTSPNELAMLLVYGGFERVDFLLHCRPYSIRKFLLDRYITCMSQDSGSFYSPKEWWNNSVVLKNKYSTIAASLLPDWDVGGRRCLADFMESQKEVLLFKAGVQRLEAARSGDTDRPLPSAMEYVYYALQNSLSTMNFASIQRDWSMEYVVT